VPSALKALVAPSANIRRRNVKRPARPRFPSGVRDADRRCSPRWRRPLRRVVGLRLKGLVAHRYLRPKIGESIKNPHAELRRSSYLAHIVNEESSSPRLRKLMVNGLLDGADSCVQDRGHAARPLGNVRTVSRPLSDANPNGRAFCAIRSATAVIL
jgi:hypothetical protein